jgi:ABC-type cobalamin/Fe3+-siderophores transport system ATPase subunit
MITKVTVRNFKRLKEASLELADHLVFAGPNNSGKTTALQALALWRLALTKWLEKRDKAKSKAKLPQFAGGESELFAEEFRNALGRAETMLRNRIVPAAYAEPLGSDPFLLETKASDVVLEPFFKEFYAMLKTYNTMPRKNFFRLAAVMKKEEVHPEVVEMLEAIAGLAC